MGEANVLQLFHLTGQKKAAVAGCRVKKGSLTVEKDVVWRVIRDEVVLHEGKIKILLRFCSSTYTFSFSMQFIFFNEGMFNFVISR